MLLVASSIYLSIYLSICLSIYLSIYLSICLSNIQNVHGNEQHPPANAKLSTHVPNEAAIPTTTGNAPQPMAK
jgi:hypothetical protein